MCSVLPEIYSVKIDYDTVESFCGELNIIVCQHCYYYYYYCQHNDVMSMTRRNTNCFFEIYRSLKEPGRVARKQHGRDFQILNKVLR